MPALLQISFIAAAIAGTIWIESLDFSTLFFIVTGLAIASILAFPFTRR
jgi:hypothetical protein